jgi:hypothetical protein
MDDKVVFVSEDNRVKRPVEEAEQKSLFKKRPRRRGAHPSVQHTVAISAGVEVAELGTRLKEQSERFADEKGTMQRRLHELDGVVATPAQPVGC